MTNKPKNLNQLIEETLPLVLMDCIYLKDSQGIADRSRFNEIGIDGDGLKEFIQELCEATADAMEVENIADRYPEDVFLPVDKEFLNEIHEYAQKQGRSIDAISGHLGRIFGNQAVKDQQQKRKEFFS